MIKKLFPLSLVLAVSCGFAQAAGDIEAGKAKAGACAACHGANGVSPAPNFPNLAGQGEKYIAKQLVDFAGGKTRNDATMLGMAAGLSDQDRANLGAFYASLKPEAGKASSQELAEAGERLYRGGNKETGVPACMGCHAPDGSGNAPAGFPQLAGQKVTYTVKTLQDFASGARSNDAGNSGMMQDIAARMTEAEMKAVAEYAAGLR